MDIDEDNDTHFLFFQTDYFLEDSFDSEHARSFFHIHPKCLYWNYTLLSCFLNHFTNFQKRKRNPCYTEVDKDGNKYFCFSFVDYDFQSNITQTQCDHSNDIQCNNQTDKEIIADDEIITDDKIIADDEIIADEEIITNDNTDIQIDDKTFKQERVELLIKIRSNISVIGSKLFVKNFFNRQNIVFKSNLRAWGKLRTQKVMQDHIYYMISFNQLQGSSRALFYHEPIFYYSIRDFSVIFYYFCKKILNFGLPYNADTYSIYEFIDFFAHKKKVTVNSFEQLKSKIAGYLYLDIRRSRIKHRLAKIKVENEKYDIINGIFISPFAKSLLENNSEEINGLMLDTTFKVLPYYDTSILLISIKNTGIPISFSFGGSENKEIYLRHFITFQKVLNIDLKKYKFLSDQGKALVSVFEELNVEHYACLRHLLVTLKYNKYSYAITNIIKCCSLQELHNCLMFYSEIFSYEIVTEEIVLRNKLLKKVGLKFEKNLILIENDKRWKEISMIERIRAKMPSTTNSLEALHGHVNSQIPRRNIFWNSVFRLAKNFIMKNNSVQEQISHNYHNEQRKTIHHGFCISQRIHDEINQYQTTTTKCNCSGNKLLSCILGVDVPCIHRLYNHAVFPECPIVNLSTHKEWNELIIEKNPLKDDESDEYISIEEFDINFLTEIIHRYSKFKNKEQIEEYIRPLYNNMKIEHDDLYINDTPCFLLRLIHIGIEHFNDLKIVTKQIQK